MRTQCPAARAPIWGAMGPGYTANVCYRRVPPRVLAREIIA